MNMEDMEKIFTLKLANVIIEFFNVDKILTAFSILNFLF